MSFFRATLFECAARCTQTCVAAFTVERLSIFPLGPCFFVATVRPFSYRFAPSRPTPFFRTAFLRSFVFWSALPCSVFAPVSSLAPLFPTWHLAYVWYTWYSHLCFSPLYSWTEFVPVGIHCAPSSRAFSFSLFFASGTLSKPC